MANRRSMSDAMALNSDKLAFIHSSGKANAEAGRAPSTAQAVPAMPAETVRPEPASPGVPTVRRGRKPKAPTQTLEPSPAFNETISYEGYPPILVSLTTRLSPPTAEALRRAALELRIQRRRPHTQQEIVEAAVRQWLKTNGFGQAA
jgi:hypothetical protein